MRERVERATDLDVAAFYGPIQINQRFECKVMRRGLRVVGLGGFIEIAPGHWWGFFEVQPSARRRSLFRHVLGIFQAIIDDGAISIRCSLDDRIPRAREMLERMGMHPTGEWADNGQEVWEYERA
ncbi:hypothetical protein GOZ83_19745 [Agrobacterium vitis]|uniref:hypothetical protein n=1 Tax=Agrobacterium vitis TaxID=373 RepID=UPI0012E6FD7C|nr:hypothetical protein [Agrobacterium vitis]MVA47292.1 hypothetical protein [Agrobacterium vitis]